jgi:hypothetical protein
MARKNPSRHTTEQLALFQAKFRDPLVGEKAVRFDAAVSSIIRKRVVVPAASCNTGSNVSIQSAASLPEQSPGRSRLQS